MADRLAWYGDPAGVNVPLAALLSDDYAKTRIQALGALASKTLNPGSPQGFTPALPDLLASARELAGGDGRYGVGAPTFAALPPVATWLERESSDERRVGQEGVSTCRSRWCPYH